MTPPLSPSTRRPFDIQKVRSDFPILSTRVHGKPLVYLDNAASTQKPQAVIEALTHFYSQNYANIHRGVYRLSERATENYENAREKIRAFINAKYAEELIFVRGATEAINLVAASFGQRLQAGDEVIVSEMEHHANIVPWQLLSQTRGIKLRVIPVSDRGELDLEAYRALLNERTRLVSVVHVSNSLGTKNPVHAVIEAAHARDIPVLVDGAQAIVHSPVDVQALNCEFYAFSGHKLFGPTGIGVLYGKRTLLESMPPYQGGGDMIRSVTFEKTLYNDLPYKFEAGTPNIAGAIGLGAAVDYLNQLDWPTLLAHEHDVLLYATEALKQFPELHIIGTAEDKAGVLSFVIDGVHPHDIGTILDRNGVAIRAGHHCTQPIMERFKVAGTARASLSFYNTKEEIDILVESIKKVLEVFR